MVECYYKSCPRHSYHVCPDEGPFCEDSVCSRTEEELYYLAAERVKELVEVQDFFDRNQVVS